MYRYTHFKKEWEKTAENGMAYICHLKVIFIYNKYDFKLCYTGF